MPCAGMQSERTAGTAAEGAFDASGRPYMKILVRGQAALVTAILVVAVTLIFLPAYRLFLAISLGIGIVIAGGIHFWHKLHPVSEEDTHNKRPLGLS